MAFYAVSVSTTVERPTAVVAVATTWAELPMLWPKLLDEVYAFVRSGGATENGHNVVLYRDDVPNVEVGVQVTGPFAPSGRVTPSVLPAGHVATAVHRGPYDALEEAHVAIKAWCLSHWHPLTGVRWEIYGDWREDPAELETTVCYLLASPDGATATPV
jgi:effector-binding domain-containing protein